MTNKLQHEIPDLTAVLPQSKRFKVGNKEYDLIFRYGEIAKLEQIYDSVGDAIEAIYDPKRSYKAVLDFLYVGLGEKYGLTMQDIEEWVGLGTAVLLREIVIEALMLSYGKSQTDGDQADNNTGEI